MNEKVANLKSSQQNLLNKSELIRLATEATQAGVWAYRPVIQMNNMNANRNNLKENHSGLLWFINPSFVEHPFFDQLKNDLSFNRFCNIPVHAGSYAYFFIAR